MRSFRTALFVTIIANSAAAQTAPAFVPPLCKNLSQTVHACSYTTLNDSCDLIIDRLDPVNPPAISMRRGKTISVKVGRTSPYEDLALDVKSVTASLPVDTLQIALTSLLGSLGKFTVTNTNQGRTPQLVINAEEQMRSDLQRISDDQSTLSEQITSPDVVISAITLAAQPTPSDLCTKTFTPPAENEVSPWLRDAPDWRKRVSELLRQKIAGAGVSPSEFQSRVDNLELRIKNLSLSPDLPNALKADIAILEKRQREFPPELADRAAWLKRYPDIAAKTSDYVARLNILLVAVQVDRANKTEFEIHDAEHPDKNNRTSVWTLNYSSRLAPTIKAVTADALPKTASPFSPLPDSSSKQALLSITAQFQDRTAVEVATGIIIPLRPFHSYAAAAVASGGTATGNVVQETLTYAIVPAALFNFEVGADHNWRGNRTAFFITGAVGGNATTGTVEFGAGPSFSWRSLVVSGLADFNRDTALSGGFVVGQALAASNPTKPLTSTVWRVKPAISISVRLPLGTGGK